MREKRGLPVRDLTVFAMLGAILFAAKFFAQILPPGMHLVGIFLAVITLTYRKRALIPLYVFILLDGVYWGFSVWWLPNLYVWLPLWGLFMLCRHTTDTNTGVVKADPKTRSAVRFPPAKKAILYMSLCALHGLAFGTLFAPVHALFFGLNFDGMITWIILGLPVDILHAASNFAAGALIAPLATILSKLDKRQI
ncbi:MAG: hypothetical protein FWC70_00585 [Defluviitaleaceae bacterium]|nr:hypothetical protein [Defluviitaleaceae bacterium]